MSEPRAKRRIQPGEIQGPPTVTLYLGREPLGRLRKAANRLNLSMAKVVRNLIRDNL